MITVTTAPARPLSRVDAEVTLLDLVAERLAYDPSLTALDRRAAAWADALAERGIGPGDRVAVDHRPGEERLAALLGVLAVGAAAVFAAPGAGDVPLAAATCPTRPGVPVICPESGLPPRTRTVRAWPGAEPDEPALVLQRRSGRLEALDMRTAVECLLRTGDVRGGRRDVPGGVLLEALSRVAMPRRLH